MKNLYFTLICLAVTLASCSNREAYDGPALLRGSTEYRWDKTIHSIFLYNGNRLTKVTRNDGTFDRYFYDGDLISNIRTYIDGDLSNEQFFTYDSQQRLVGYKSLDYAKNIGSRKEFIYNSDGTITRNQYVGSSTLQNHSDRPGAIYFENGVMSKVTYEISGGTVITYDLAYDDKNTPIRNALGFDKIYFASDNPVGFQHNITQVTISYSDNPAVDGFGYDRTYTNSGYPLSQINVGPSSIAGSTYEFNYE